MKMNALLFAPALALLMLLACPTRRILASAALAIALQARSSRAHPPALHAHSPPCPLSCCSPPPSWPPTPPPTWAAPLSLAAASTSSGP